MSVRTLDSFLGLAQKRKQADETDSNDKENVPPSKKVRITWNNSWPKQFPWLEKVIDEDGKLKGVCNWCKTSGRQ